MEENVKNDAFEETKGPIIEALKNTYCFYRQKYVLMGPSYTKTFDHYYKNGTIASHLRGDYALAVFAPEKITRFISIDVDAGGKAAVRKVMAALEEIGIPHEEIHVSTSGKKGYHVDIFFKPFIYINKAMNLYRLMIWRSGLDPKKVEFRPTNTQAIKIPLGVHAKTGNRCWFLDRDTLEPIEDEGYIFQIDGMNSDALVPILAEWNKKHWNVLYAEMVCEGTGGSGASRNIEFNDKYYEEKRLTEPGTRHNTMVEIARDLRLYGAGRERIEDALTKFYHKQDPGMIDTGEREVMRDIKGIAEWAENSVAVSKREREDCIVAKEITFTPGDIEKIFMVGTRAARKVAFLIYCYCKIFGAAHVSYDKICSITGCTYATANTAVKKFCGIGALSRKSGGCHYSNGRLIREANTYFIKRDDVVEYDRALFRTNGYTFAEKITPENFDRIYYGVLAGLCTDEYLRARLTKGEMEAIANARGCADDSAGRDDAGLQDVCAG